MKKICLALFLAFGCAASTQATVLVDRLLAPADVGPGACSHCGDGGLNSNFRGFAHFTLAADAVLTDLDWEINTSADGGVDTIRVSLWNADRSLLLFSNDYALGDITETPLAPPVNGSIFAIESVSLPDIAVGAGAYQLSIVGFGASSHQYIWLGAYGGADSWFDGNGNEGAIDATLTLRLSDNSAAVPEPSSWAMMICGFAAAGSILRRRGAVRADGGLLKGKEQMRATR
jgi:hypothetical protein